MSHKSISIHVVATSKTRNKFDWGEKEENAFQLIKQKLCSAPILAIPEGSGDFVVYCDASHKGLGDVLMQREKLFPQLHQLDTFYNALNSNDQDSLNSAAGGNFLDKIPRDCLAIIESKSKVRYSRDKAIVSKFSTSSSTPGVSHDVSELKDMVRALLLDKKNQSQAPATVKAVEESCVTCGGAHSYRNYPATDGNVYRDNIQEYVSQAAAVNYNQGNTGYRPPMVANQIRPPAYQSPAYQALSPQTQGVSKDDFQNYIKANDAVMKNMQDQNQNMQNQITNLTEMLTKFMNANSASTLGSSSLPSDTVANSRGDMKAITTRSGVSYDGPQVPPPPSSLPKVVEHEPELVLTSQINSTRIDDDDFRIQKERPLTLERLLNSDLTSTLPPEEQKFEELKTVEPSSDELPDLELKDLPPHLEYAFLEGTDKLPVIIAKDLKDEDKTALLKVLRSHKRA
ncbi:reverse transcriptase domain-containing protein [Tanacetum coccineum]